MMRMQHDDVLRNVASNLRRIRTAAGMSQATLAERSGLSRRTIVGLEAGEANVSLSGLDQIAVALATTFVALVSPPDAGSRAINEVAWRGADGSVATLLASIPTRSETQVWEWTLAAGARYDARPDPEGWNEVVVVTAGRLRIDLASGPTRLGVGDQVNYSSAQEYAYAAEGDGPARFFRMVLC